ncbi:hypothetical protein MYAM1_003178 [Malassezia yamatoensis]|uniref:Protein HID1 n=1 Tax=Malassezia yamatoensis TaxID=253288 RepID=A0AAJ5YTH2_9BASI|nr:hypothetical protein MYAM1_003178 [Malassezia yamatoensis]
MLAFPSRLFSAGADETLNAFANSEEHGLPRLYLERHISAADHRYWVQFTTKFQSAEEVMSVLSISVLRRAAQEAPENIVTLVEVLALHLESLVDDPHLAPVPPYNPGGFKALFASTAPPKPIDDRNRTQEVLNCCRVLTRVIPILYESNPTSKSDSVVDNLESRALWTSMPRSRLLPTERRASQRPETKPASSPEPPKDGQFILSDGADPDTSQGADPLHSPAQQNAFHPDKDNSVMTGKILLDTVMELLFHAGFSMPWTDEQLNSSIGNDISRVHFTIWEAGIGCTVNLEGTSSSHLDHRIEMLRLLLALLSKPIYTAPQQRTSTDYHALQYVACDLERPVVLSFLCSMLNTVANYTQGDQWSFFSSQPDPQRDTLCSLCLQTLCATLTYEPRSDHPNADNRFVFYLTKLYRASDFAFLATGFSKLFHVALSQSRGPFELGSNTGNMFAKPYEEHVSEILVLFWFLFRINASFRDFLVGNRQLSLDVLSWLLYVALANKNATSSLGQAQLALFLLQDLTANRIFCVHLTSMKSASDLTVPSRWIRVNGNVAMDALIQAVYQILTRSNNLMNPMYPALLLLLQNTAPYWRNLSLESATRLESLLQQFSAPRFLLANESHPELLAILLSSFSRMLIDQFSENPDVVYVLVRCAPLLHKIYTISFNQALTSIHRSREHARRDMSSEAVQTTSSQPVPNVSESPQSNAEQTSNTITESLDDVSVSVSEHSPSVLDAPVSALTDDRSEGLPKAESDPVNDSDRDQLEDDDLKNQDRSNDTRVENAESNKNTVMENQLANQDSKDRLSNRDQREHQVSKDQDLDNDHGENPKLDTDQKSNDLEKDNSNESDPKMSPVDTTDASKKNLTESDHSNPSSVSNKVGESTTSLNNSIPSNPASPTNHSLETLSDDLLTETARSVGKNGFVPTAEWFKTWQSKLPFSVIESVLEQLVPRVNEFCAQPNVLNSSNAHDQVLAYLREQASPEIETDAKEFRK